MLTNWFSFPFLFASFSGLNAGFERRVTTSDHSKWVECIGWLRQFLILDGIDSWSGQCSFGRDRDLFSCGWTDAGSPSMRWQLSSGRGAYFRGGPPADAYGDKDGISLSASRQASILIVIYEHIWGGYILTETSRGASAGAMLSSSIQNGTLPDGRCIVFQYAINGPNSEQLSLFIQPIGQGSNDTFTVGKPKDTLWQSRGALQQEWQTAAILYSFGQPHQVLNNSPESNKQCMNQPYRFPLFSSAFSSSWFSRHRRVTGGRFIGDCRVTLSWTTSI